MGLLSRLVGGKSAAQLDQLLAGRQVLRRDEANCLGVQSLGKGQVRGNGYLALTPDELIFLQWVPRREVRVARGDIVEVGTKRSFLGKSIGYQLLHVRWRDDEAAWFVKDLDGWLSALGAMP